MISRSTPLDITDSVTQKGVPARIVDMGPEEADAWIDRGWWTWTGVPDDSLRAEPDWHWHWEQTVRHFLEAEDAEAVALITEGGDVQGAMIYMPHRPSLLEPGRFALYIERLATAPWNRSSIQQPRRYSGVGRALMNFAIRESAATDGDGRILLSSLREVNTMDFYREFGLVDTGQEHASLPLLELPHRTADIIMRQMPR